MLQEDLAPGLIVVHGNQPETLRDLVVAWIKRYPLRPLENEHILVQSNGVAQWLKLALAADPTQDGGGCGIAAALEFHLPAAYFWQAYRAVLGKELVPETSSFDKPRLTWRLMRLLPALLSIPDEAGLYTPLRRFLVSDDDRRKCQQLAERLADLFDQYQVYRADWLAAWARGDDQMLDALGKPIALEKEQQWQAALWRAILADVAQDIDAAALPRQLGRAAVHQAFLDQAHVLAGDARPAGLPRRLIVFGISSLPGQALEVLATLSRWTQLLVCVHNPCQHHWADTVSDQELLRSNYRRQARRHGMPEALTPEMLHQHAHPLLAAWGKQGRDFIGLLDRHDSHEAQAQFQGRFQAIGSRTDLFTSTPKTTLLQQLQDDILELRPLHESRDLWPGIDITRDRSIRFHSTHSPMREVEVLHDQLLAAFNDDSTLTPRDILVMVPDIQAYAPHIQSVFGLPARTDPRHIPYNIVDQGQRTTDPLLQALQRLLQLPQSRLGVSELLDLLEVPALAHRFQIAPSDLPLLQRWIRGANIRWGLHAAHRSSLGLPSGENAAPANSWLFGLRRMLLGYAAGNAHGPWNGIEPHDEVGGLDAALLGPLVRLLDTLEATWVRLSEPASPDGWTDRLEQLLQDFFSAQSDADQYTLLELTDKLHDWQQICAESRLDEALPLSVVSEHWLAGMDEGDLNQRFFGGAVTFATLMPMRAIPFRRVYLLGMNDGDYPRSRVVMDFDLMGRHYRPGDRSRRTDDHYMFLEALLSARDHLHLSWVGHSVTDNSPRTPSVLLGQLRDHLAAGWCLQSAGESIAESGEALVQALTTTHRLQPFSLDYFASSQHSGATSALFTYAAEWRTATAQTSLPDHAGQILSPMAFDDAQTLRVICEFLRDPVKAFLRRRLGAYLDQADNSSDDQEPFELDPLKKWALQNELVRQQIASLQNNEDLDDQLLQALQSLQRKGEIAAGAFGQSQAEALAKPLEGWLERYRQASEQWPHQLDHGLAFEWSTHLEGSDIRFIDQIDGLRKNDAAQLARLVLEPSDVVVQSHYRGDVMLTHWVMHLACHVAGQPLTTVVISKTGNAILQPMPAEAALRLWNDLIQAWHEGMRRPLPLAKKAGFKWLRIQQNPSNTDASHTAESEADSANDDAQDPLDKVCQAYEGDDHNRGDCSDNPYLQRVYPSFEALTASGEFFELTERLLRPLQSALPVKAGRKPKTPASGAPA